MNNGMIKEGFISLLRNKYGFISKDYPASCHRGLYFNDLQLKNFPFKWLEVGEKLHFQVGQNERSCIAKEIFVIRQQPQPQPQPQRQVGSLETFPLRFVSFWWNKQHQGSASALMPEGKTN